MRKFFTLLSTFLCLCSLAFAAGEPQQRGTFKCAALNVDGLPASINFIVNIDLNPDSKGAEGATAIGKKMAEKGWDFIGLSEDFNYHENIVGEMSEYSSGTWGGAISVANANLANYINQRPLFSTDGLELLWKSSIFAGGERRTVWTDSYGYTDNGADGLINKGFRYYAVTVEKGITVDVYVLHMDAEVTDGDIAARESQINQLVAAIKANKNKRPIIVMGDTNCRYTRDRLKELFIDEINADSRFTVNDCWIEKCKDNTYPEYGSDALMAEQLGYVEGEIVDKMFYINNSESPVQIVLNSFCVDTDFKNELNEPLADHYPVVSEFGYIVDFDPVTPPSPDPVDDAWNFETIKTDGSVSYYLYNAGTEKYLNDNNGVDDEPSVLWTVNGNSIKSANGKYISLTSRNSGSVFRPNWVFTTVSNASNGTMSAIEAVNDAYYQIGNKVNVSTTSQQTRFVTISNNTLSYCAKNNSDNTIEANAQWIFVSKAQYDAKNNVLDYTAMIDAMNENGIEYTVKKGNMGFDADEYAPYNGATQLKAFEDAYDAIENDYKYTQSDINSITANLSAEWEANTEEVNAIAPAYTSANVSASNDYVYGEETGYTMPLNGGQTYAMKFNTTGMVTITIQKKDGNIISTATCDKATDNVTYKFNTQDNGDYVVRLSSATGADITEMSIMLYDYSQDVMPWEGKTMADGDYYLFNKAAGLFISASEEDGTNAKTAMKNNHPTLFTVRANENGSFSLTQKNGNLGVVIATKSNSSTPTFVLGSANADEGTELTVTGDASGYVLGVTKKWGGLFNNAYSYTAYLSTTPDLANGGNATLDASGYSNDAYAEWVLVSQEEYETLAQARVEAIERLEAAIAEARVVQEEITDVPGLNKLLFSTTIAAGETIINIEKSNAWNWISNLVSVGNINATAKSIEDQSTEFAGLADYYAACLSAIENIEKISSGFTLRSLTTTAKASLEVAASKTAMTTAMTVLRAGVAAYLQTINTFANGQVFTGMIGNHSFDTGDLAQWYSVGFDLSKVSISDITTAIGGGDASGLADAVTINAWDESTKAVKNEAPNAMDDGDKKYYLSSKQMVMEPLLGMPAGIYEFKAKVACNPGLLNTNKIHMNALVVPREIVQQAIGDVTSGDFDWNDIMGNFDMSQYMGLFLQNGKLYSGSTNCKSQSEFQDAEIKFLINEGDIVIIGMNAGITPFIGTESYRADNLQLTYIRSANDILDIAKVKLGEALEGLAEVKANYIAGEVEEELVQAPFTYDKALTEAYNAAYRVAKDKYDNDDLKAVQDKIDLNNIEGIDAAIAGLYEGVVAELNAAKEAFDKGAFIAPDETTDFNVVMKDDWTALIGQKWTGNAVTAGEDLTMRFSDKPGQSCSALAFNFESASEEYTNRIYACVNDFSDKYYLCRKDDKLSLTTVKDDALVITAKPSYTVNGEIELMVGDLYLGTTNSDNTLVETNAGTLFRPTHTGLSIIPAEEVEVTVSVTIPDESEESNLGFATMILPFDAEVPMGFSAYTVESIGENKMIQKGEAATLIKANTPYYVEAVVEAEGDGEYKFAGVPHAVKTSYSNGILVGCYSDYETQNGDEYKMMSYDGLAFFYRKDAQPIVANECYLKTDFDSEVIYINEVNNKQVFEAYRQSVALSKAAQLVTGEEEEAELAVIAKYTDDETGLICVLEYDNEKSLGENTDALNALVNEFEEEINSLRDDIAAIVDDDIEIAWDGYGHSAEITFGENSGFEVVYCDNEDGTYTAESPAYTEIGDYTVWYKVYKSGLVAKRGCVNFSIVEGETIEFTTDFIETETETTGIIINFTSRHTIFASQFLKSMGALIEPEDGQWYDAVTGDLVSAISSDIVDMNQFYIFYADYGLQTGEYDLILPTGFFAYIKEDYDLEATNFREVSKYVSEATANGKTFGKVQAISISVFVEKGIVTGINSVNTLADDAVVYDLAGRRINIRDAKGIVIANGKKVIVK